MSTQTLGPAAATSAPPAGARRRPSLLRRAVFLIPAGLALLAGLDAALMLIGLPAPVRTSRLPEIHGVLMVIGFVGTLISLERAVALRRRTGFAAPALLGLGALLEISPAPLRVGQAVMLAGTLATTAVYAALWRRQRDEAVLVQTLGSVLSAGAVLLWLGGVPVPLLLPWLVGFVVLTIGGERLELARLAMGPGAGSVLVLLSGGLLAGVVAALLWPGIGAPLFGAALLALGGWLAAHDVAWRTIRASGAPQFMAGCMLAGYFWLVVAGLTWLLGGPALTGPRYDVVIHAMFLGFTISMIMAHAPSILPAVLRRALPYHPVLIVPAALMHAGLVLRLWIGDGYGVGAAWQAGGLINIIALLLFVVVAAGLIARAAAVARARVSNR
jgi:hypothetical protein